ncbi:RNA polymerase sigma factor RpoD [biofilm metagenome]
MRLLTEYMSVPEVNGAVVAEKQLAKDELLTAPKEPDTVENRNLQLAKQVETYKTQLTIGVTRFPVTALWILSKYDSHTATDEQDEDSKVGSESDPLLSEINKQYQSFNQSINDTDGTGFNYVKAGSALTASLQKFPFAFEDLVKLVDVIVYAYKYRGLTFNPGTYSDQKQAEIILKRLEGTICRGRTKLADQFKALDLHLQAGQHLFLSVEEMSELMPDIVMAEHNWLKYRQQLASANAKLVLFIANQYKGSFLDFDDLVQEGHTGLLKAVDRFKYRLGFQFSTYAGYWIRQAISRALSRSERVVRIPCGQIANINRLFRSKDELLLKTGVEPTVKELADFCQFTTDEVNHILAISQTSVAMESFDDSDDEPTFAPIDFLEQKVFNPSFNMIASTQLESLVRKAVHTLNPREAKIICSHFGVDTDQQQTLQEIGDELNLTRERVRQIQVVALNKIRMRYGEYLLSFVS